MNEIRKNSAVNLKRVMGLLVAITISFTIVPGFKTEARAGGGGAFLGGMVAGHVIGGAVRRSRIRTAAAVEAASQPRTETVYVQQPRIQPDRATITPKTALLKSPIPRSQRPTAPVV